MVKRSTRTTTKPEKWYPSGDGIEKKAAAQAHYVSNKKKAGIKKKSYTITDLGLHIRDLVGPLRLASTGTVDRVMCSIVNGVYDHDTIDTVEGRSPRVWGRSSRRS